MFNKDMMLYLEALKLETIHCDSSETYITYSCDCTGGCTDNCYACSSDSQQQW